MSRDSAAIRDQLGNDPEEITILKSDINETVEIFQGPLKAFREGIGHSWIVGSSTNGIVGPNTNTADGEQQLVGNFKEIFIGFIANQDNNFIDFYNFEEYYDSDNSTATINTSNERVDFTSGQIALSTEIYKGETNVKEVNLIADYTGTLKFEVSFDDGTTWTEVLNNGNAIIDISKQGKSMIYRATETGASTAQLNSIQIGYKN